MELYTVAQLAVQFGVKPATVRAWMRSGALKFRLWARGRSSVKVVFFLNDVLEFMDKKLGMPGIRDGSLSSRLWDWRQCNGSKGGKASAKKRWGKPAHGNGSERQ